MALRTFPTKRTAMTFAEKAGLPNVDVDAYPHEGGFLPLIYLRSDQMWCADRLRERGIMVMREEDRDAQPQV